MIPILLSGTTVTGFLADALTCVVTEERNGIYELSLTYPVTGSLFSELAVDRFVKAKPNDTSDFLNLLFVNTVKVKKRLSIRSGQKDGLNRFAFFIARWSASFPCARAVRAK